MWSWKMTSMITSIRMAQYWYYKGYASKRTKYQSNLKRKKRPTLTIIRLNLKQNHKVKTAKWLAANFQTSLWYFMHSILAHDFIIEWNFLPSLKINPFQYFIVMKLIDTNIFKHLAKIWENLLILELHFYFVHKL